MSRREALSRAYCWSGLAWLVRRIIARRRVSIVLWHDPTLADFERYLTWLSTRYAFISLNGLVSAIEGGSFAGLPDYSLVVVLDDGHRGNARLVDLFRRYRVRPTIFVCTQIVTTKRHFWFFDVSDEEGETLKRRANHARVAVLAAQGKDPAREHLEGDRQALSLREMETMRDFVDFQPHTRTHPVLTTCSIRECWEEIAGSKEDLEKLLGTPTSHFAFPNGDYTDRERRHAIQAGYRSARTVDQGWNGPRSDTMTLRILTTGEDGLTTTRLASDMAGMGALISLLRGRKEPILAVTE